MTASGIVCRAAGDGRVEIELAAPAACRGCEGLCSWRRFGAGAARAELPCTAAGLRAGDAVEVTLPEAKVLAGAAALYGLPLAAILGGAAAGNALTASDAGSLAGALAAVVLSAAAAPRLRRRLERWVLRGLRIEPRIEPGP